MLASTPTDLNISIFDVYLTATSVLYGSTLVLRVVVYSFLEVLYMYHIHCDLENLVAWSTLFDSMYDLPIGDS